MRGFEPSFSIDIYVQGIMRDFEPLFSIDIYVQGLLILSDTITNIYTL
jgi:hypothetical protein